MSKSHVRKKRWGKPLEVLEWKNFGGHCAHNYPNKNSNLSEMHDVLLQLKPRNQVIPEWAIYVFYIQNQSKDLEELQTR